MRWPPRPRAFGRTHRARAFGHARLLTGASSSAWTRSLPGLLAVVAAVLLAGLAVRAVDGTRDGRRGGAASRPQPLVAGGAVSVPVPAGWSAAGRAPRLPGLAIADPVVLDNRGSRVQVVVGLLPATSRTLLPAGFVETLGGELPRPRSVLIGHRLRGYHYAGLVHPGTTRLVDMYVAPTTLGTVTVACVAEAVESLVDGCMDVVSGLGIADRGRPLPVDELAAFREVLAGRLAALDAVAGRARRLLAAASTPVEQARALAPLPAAYREAADAVASLAPRSPAWPGRAVAELRRTGEAYADYARSLAGGELEPYLEARARLAARRAALRRLLARRSALPIAQDER